MNAGDPIHRAIATIAELGIATHEALDAQRAAWMEQALSETWDEQDEAATFIRFLLQNEVLTPEQGRHVLQLLASGEGADPNIGRRFGDYVAEQKIGEGAMGKVYRAYRVDTLQRDFVVKVLMACEDEVDLIRFQREAKIMRALKHPNVMRVFDHGETEDGEPYMVLEFVEGTTLEDVLAERGRFRWEVATRTLRRIAFALGAAHQMGVIHRDVKPQNIFVARAGSIKVFDFGLAKVKNDPGKLTRAGEILGSPAYIAPEQWGDHEIDHRVDLFALGVIYYQLLTGQVPFRARSVPEYAQRIMAGDYQPPGELVSGIPARVSELVTYLLETDRDYRPPKARTIVKDIERILEEQPPNVPRLAGGITRPDQTPLRFPLIGASSYTIGSAPGCSVRLEGKGVAPRHATIERTPQGLLLRDQGTPGGTRVNKGRVAEAVLKHKDVVRFGSFPSLVFVAGRVGQRDTRRFATGRHSRPTKAGLRKAAAQAAAAAQAEAGAPDPKPVLVTGLLAAALEHSAHPRVLLSCFESLDANTMELKFAASEDFLVQLGVEEAVAKRARSRAREIWQAQLPDRFEALFATTRENLGERIEAWLPWWMEVRERHPRQLRAPGPRVTGRLRVTPVLKGRSGIHELDTGEFWTLGRSEDVDILVPHRSVSRVHALLYRLLTRFALIDPGSRFGVRVNGERREVALLNDGDEVTMGKGSACLEASLEMESKRASSTPGVDPHTFYALAEMRSESTVRALINLVNTPRLLASLERAAGSYCEAAEVEAGFQAFLDAQRLRAQESLPALTQKNYGSDYESWAKWLKKKVHTLPAQVAPLGWGV